MSSSPTTPRLILLSDRKVDLGARVVLQDGAQPVELTQLEAAFLEYLAARPGETISREVLLRDVWGYAARVQSRAIDKSVHRLRTRIEVDPAEPRHLLGVRGVGYRLEGARLYTPMLDLEAAVVLLRREALRAGVDPSRLDADSEELYRVALLLHGHADPLRLVALRFAFQGPGELEEHLLQAIRRGHDLPERWLSALRACVEEQWAAKDEHDRRILRRLAGFVGAMTSADALAVQADVDRGRGLEVIERAVAERLVWVEAGASGARRLRLAPAVRAHALQELTRRGEHDAVIDAGVARTLLEGEALARELGRGDVGRARAGLQAILPELEAIIELTRERAPRLAVRALLVVGDARARREPARLLAMVDALMPGPTDAHASMRASLLVLRAVAVAALGRPAEAAQGCVEALALSSDPVVRARAMVGLSGTGFWTAERIEESTAHIEEALAMLVDLEEPRLEARLWLALASQLQRRGEHERALASVRRSLERFRASNDQEMLAHTLQYLVHSLYQMARFEEALAASDEVLSVGSEVEGRYFELRTWLSRFCCLWDLGRVEEAAVCAERARVLAMAEGRKHPLILAHSACGYAALEADLHDQARFHLQTARRIAEESGHRLLYDYAHLDLGIEAHLRGALDEAGPLYSRFLAAAAGTAPVATRWWGLCLALLLGLELARSDLVDVRARELLECLGEEHHARYTHVFDTLALAREALADGLLGAPLLAGRLRRYADGMRLEHGHEPRQLALLARRVAARIERPARA